MYHFTRFETLCVQIRSGVFPLGVTTKKGTLQKVTVIFHLFAAHSPFNQI